VKQQTVVRAIGVLLILATLAATIAALAHLIADNPLT
jgi:hypothetical protein